MAANPQLQVPTAQRTSLPPLAGLSSKPKELRMTYTQVIALWLALLGLMIVVFFIGLLAGREQGFEQALEEQEEVLIRLPVERASVSPSVIRSAEVEVPDVSKKAVGEELSNVKAAEVTKETAKAKTSTSAAPSSLMAKPAKPPKLKEVPKLKAPSKPARKTLASVSTPAKVVREAAAQKQQPAVKQHAVTNRLSKGWYVQFASRTSLRDANALAGRFSAKGYKPVIQRAVAKKATVYRVVIGPFKEKKAALQTRRKLKGAYVSGNTPYLRHIL